MFFSKQDIIDDFLETVGEGVVKFVDTPTIEKYMLNAFKKCYPKYHNVIVISLVLENETDPETIIEIPNSVEKISELLLMNDGGNRITFDINLTDWDLMPKVSGSITRGIKIHRPLPACTIQIIAQGILDFCKEKIIDVPSITPIVECMSMFYFNKLKGEATRNRDKEAYVMYRNQKLDAQRDYMQSLNDNRMAPMLCKYSSDKNRLRIANKNYRNVIQILWRN